MSLTSKIKKEIVTYRWIVLAVLVIAGWFYWFQWRPVEIRKECSYVEQYTTAVPALTQTQIDQQKQAYNACQKKYPPTTELDGLFGGAPWQLNSSQCASLPTGYGETPHPAEPSKPYYTPANTATYDFCLHTHGL